jgi:hypothetical protein
VSVRGYLVFVPFENVASMEYGGTPTTPGSVTRPDMVTVATTPGHLAGPFEVVGADQVDRWTRHILHVSQHNRMVIGLGGRLQKIAGEMRAAAGLKPFGWNTAFRDADFGECSVHVEGCRGQETHGGDDASGKAAATDA